jgi:hypothetical protein
MTVPIAQRLRETAAALSKKSVSASGVAAPAAAMWQGHSKSGLSQRVAELELSSQWAQKGLLQ